MIGDNALRTAAIPLNSSLAEPTPYLSLDNIKESCNGFSSVAAPTLPPRFEKASSCCLVHDGSGNRSRWREGRVTFTKISRIADSRHSQSLTSLSLSRTREVTRDLFSSVSFSPIWRKMIRCFYGRRGGKIDTLVRVILPERSLVTRSPTVPGRASKRGRKRQTSRFPASHKAILESSSRTDVFVRELLSSSTLVRGAQRDAELLIRGYFDSRYHAGMLSPLISSLSCRNTCE